MTKKQAIKTARQMRKEGWLNIVVVQLEQVTRDGSPGRVRWVTFGVAPDDKRTYQMTFATKRVVRGSRVHYVDWREVTTRVKVSGEGGRRGDTLSAKRSRSA